MLSFIFAEAHSCMHAYEGGREERTATIKSNKTADRLKKVLVISRTFNKYKAYRVESVMAN